MSQDTISQRPSYESLVAEAQQQRSRARDEAFSRLVDQFQIAAQSWAYQILGDAHAAQDAAQEAFIAAFERLDDLRDPASFPSWLRRIVWTQCQRHLRQDTHVLPLDDEAASGDDTALLAEQRLLQNDVQQAINALPDHERVVIDLFYLKGYSQQEIAQRLSLPLTTIKKRLQYGREHLRERLPAMMLRLWQFTCLIRAA